jgi:hypothetical protein
LAIGYWQPAKALLALGHWLSAIGNLPKALLALGNLPKALLALGRWLLAKTQS